MDELKLDQNPDHKTIQIDNNSSETKINIKNDESTMLGVELLANRNNNKADLSVSDSIGYSSGEESTSVKSDKNITPNEDYDFFNQVGENNIELKINEEETKDPEVKNIQAPLPQDDPIINSTKEAESSEFRPIHAMSSQDIKNEKIDLIYKFKKLEGQGIRTTMNYNMNSQLEDMRNEYFKLKKQREIDNSIKFQRKVMMAAITGLEFLNNKFDPFDIKLDGWSESVNENINDYDEVFEELAEKYGGKSEVAPEIKLLMMLGGSAFMFHLTNTLFKSSIPGMDDIMKQNPDLMKQFAKAAVGSIGQETQKQPEPVRTNVPKPQRRDMSGPAGMEDIMNEMNFQANDIPDLDNISLLSGESGNRSTGSGGITLNL
mgnify:CR=1 FL=1|tara:strand:+ start:3657 stop:4781 length:1125 start_codon:yes stop_codon:yes gene_type:complete